MKLIKTLVLIVMTMAVASVLCFAVATAFAMAAVCLIALLTAYAVSPEDVKAIMSAFTSKVDGWVKDVSELIRAMIDVIRDAAQTAKTAAGINDSENRKAEEVKPEVPVQRKMTRNRSDQQKPKR